MLLRNQHQVIERELANLDVKYLTTPCFDSDLWTISFRYRMIGKCVAAAFYQYQYHSLPPPYYQTGTFST